MQVNDRVYWHAPYTKRIYSKHYPLSCQSQSGYIIPAIIKKHGKKQIQIEICTQKPYEKIRHKELIWVGQESLTQRIIPVSTLHEEMHIQVGEFLITTTNPYHGYAAFPQGVFYGLIDGETATAPASSPESALHDAYLRLQNGQFEVSIKNRFEFSQKMDIPNVTDIGRYSNIIQKLRHHVSQAA